MVQKLKSRRYKKRRIVSSKKRRQPKTRTKRYRRKTRKTRGGVKRSVPSTPTQEYGEYNGEPVAPRKNRTIAVGDAVVGANLFQGFSENQENINPQIPMAIPPQTPMQGIQTPVFTPVQEPMPPAQQQANNLFVQGDVTPQGNLNNALDEAYMESITTPQTIGVRSDLNIQPFGYDEAHEIIDDYDAPNEDEYYETEEDEED
jgi:hypothetical protein